MHKASHERLRFLTRGFNLSFSKTNFDIFVVCNKRNTMNTTFR